MSQSYKQVKIYQRKINTCQNATYELCSVVCNAVIYIFVAKMTTEQNRQTTGDTMDAYQCSHRL